MIEAIAPTSTAGRPIRNPRLSHLACLRCGDQQALALRHDGCPACAAQGHHVSLGAVYRAPAPPGRVNLPYEGSPLDGEGNTPLRELPALARALGVGALWAKLESANPTGSHKDRMSAQGVAQAREFGAHTVVLASSGNAAVSAAHYAQRAGLRCEVATYDGMAPGFAQALDRLGAARFSFPDNSGRWAYVKRRAREPGVMALTNHHLPALGSAPLAVEGYKTIAAEIVGAGVNADHILVPTARGDLLWGIHTGYAELSAGGGPRAPRLWAVEPFARLSAVLAGAELHGSYPGHTRQFSTAGATVTWLQWAAVTESGGGAWVVDDVSAARARSILHQHGVDAELCAASPLAAAQQAVAAGRFGARDTVVLVVTADSARDPARNISFD